MHTVTIFSNSLISSFHAIIVGLDSKFEVVSFESNVFNMPVFKREKVGIKFLWASNTRQKKNFFFLIYSIVTAILTNK